MQNELQDAAKVTEQMFLDYLKAADAAALLNDENSEKYNSHHAWAIEKVLKKVFGYTDAQIKELCRICKIIYYV